MVKSGELLHCRTEKGKGLKEAEENPAKYHGVGPRAIKAVRAEDEEGDGLPAAAGASAKPIPTFTDAFADAILIKRLRAADPPMMEEDLTIAA